MHEAQEVAVLASERGFTRLGILGTRYLMEGPVYRSKLSLRTIGHESPRPRERSEIDRIIFEELVYGRFEEAARESVRNIIGGLAKRGCDAVVLGCTEIPLLISEADSPLPALDSTRMLARAALREATQGAAEP